MNSYNPPVLVNLTITLEHGFAISNEPFIPDTDGDTDAGWN